MELIISSILSILLTTLGISISIRYSSKYHIKGPRKYREKYLISEKISHGTKSGVLDSARIILAKSSIDKAMGFMDVSLTSHPEEIQIDRYAFIHTCTHILFAPGKTILKNEKEWEEKTPSNQFEDYIIKSRKLDTVQIDLIPIKIQRYLSECRSVESSFEYPSIYTGPRYKQRLLILAKNIGIVYCRVVYMNGDVDEYCLKEWKVPDNTGYWLPVNKRGNYWVYDIFCQHGPNKLNICE